MADKESSEERSRVKIRRKRTRGVLEDPNDSSPAPSTKRVSPPENNGADSDSSGDQGLVIADPALDDSNTFTSTKPSSPDNIEDLPVESLIASTLTQFSDCLRPSLMTIYPAASSAQINSLINAKWKALKQARREQAGNLGSSSGRHQSVRKVESEEKEEVRPRRRAARNVSKQAYIEEEPANFESPLQSDEEMSDERKQVRKKRPRGRPPRVPPMKIKMIGRSRDSDSPIFCTQTVSDTDSDRKSDRKRSAGKSNTERESSEQRKEEEEEEEMETEEVINFSRSPSEDDDDDEDSEDESSEECDSEGEHADYCYQCHDGGELLCCDKCPKAYHLQCLYPPLKNIPEGDWKCPRCTVKKLPSTVEKILTWRWLKIEQDEDEPTDDSAISDSITPVPQQPQKKVPRIRQYFVKWCDKSYWDCSWTIETGLDVHQPTKLRPYMRKHDMETPPPLELPAHLERRRRRRSSHYDEKTEEKELMLLKAGVRPEWLLIQRVINSKPSKKFGTLYLVKWKDLPYDKATWEPLDEGYPHLRGSTEAVKQYEKLKVQMEPLSGKKRKRASKQKLVDPKKKYSEQPEFITETGGKLHAYQLEGLNWIRFSWAQGTNTILADEMGLGKTIQTIAFLYSLVKEGHCNGPFLISAPLSTIINWEREFEFWAPDLYVVTYHGSKENRAVIREHEFSFVGGAIKGGSNRLHRMKKDAPIKFHVLLTSYEFISVDATVLQSIDWSVLIVDEAHRLKNNQSKFFRVLSQYTIRYKLLLTGTPLQNNLEELFHLLNFLSRDTFQSLEEFQEQFADISKEDQVSKLHDMLAPHLLRRLKADVLKNMPSKSELIVRVDLAPLQKKYYRWILTKNYEKLNKKGSQPVSLINIMMDLKKCCNHPYLFPTAAEEAPLTPAGYYEGTALIASCGKLIVLEKMLKKLRSQGHRVLIFSQMTKALDILEDFLEHLKYKYERIDGGVTGGERQQCIDRFNAAGSELFVFLLSTRAGGLGINLATADTVVIFDSDWNPHNDIQAFSRAHRIGQANKVMIYRFVTRNSVEERICEVAKRKMMLTHLVVRGGIGTNNTQPSLSKRELDDILKFGTEELFKDEGEKTMGIVYDDEAIERLLDRSHGGGDEREADENLLANEYLSQFKVASYVMKEKAENEPEPEIIKAQEPETPQDPDFWEKLLRHHYEQQRELEAAKLGKGKRVRKQINYMDSMSADLSELKEGNGEDESAYEESDEQISDEESDDEVDFYGSRSRKPKLAARKTDEVPPLLSKVNNSIQVYGFNPRQRKAFLNNILRYGIPPPDVYNSYWLPKELRSKGEATFNAYISMFMRHLCEPETPNSECYVDGVPKPSVPRQNILTRIGIMRLIKNKIDQYKDLNGDLSLPSQEGSNTETATDANKETADTDTVANSEKSNGEEKKEESKGVSVIEDEVKDVMEVESKPDEAAAANSDMEIKSEEKPEDKLIVSMGGTNKSKLMFNIADGGFTELHSLWSSEKTQGFDPMKWGRHHDYWLLCGIIKHGYCRWAEICTDPKLALLNKPFPPEETVSDAKNRFLLRRFKLLEQALAIEEQLHRASSAGLMQDPNKSIMLLHSRFTDLDCLADGHQALVKECISGSNNAILLMRKALGKMEELLLEMKQDVSKLSIELVKCPSVSHQLKLDELSMLSKLANRDHHKLAILSKQSNKDMIPAATVSTISTTGTTTPALTTSSLSAPGQQHSVITSLNTQNGVKQKTLTSTSVHHITSSNISTDSTTSNKKSLQLSKIKGATALNVPGHHYVEGATILMPATATSGQTLSVVPAGTGQQVVYFAPGNVATAQQVTAVQSPAAILTPVCKSGGHIQYTLSQPTTLSTQKTRLR